MAVSRAWSGEAREDGGSMVRVGSAVGARGELEEEVGRWCEQVCRWDEEDEEVEEWRREMEDGSPREF
jgi:hypothetical protein